MEELLLRCNVTEQSKDQLQLEFVDDLCMYVRRLCGFGETGSQVIGAVNHQGTP